MQRRRQGDISCAIRDNEFSVVGEVMAFTKAGIGCGGCLPLVTDLLKQALEAIRRVRRPSPGPDAE